MAICARRRSNAFERGQHRLCPHPIAISGEYHFSARYLAKGENFSTNRAVRLSASFYLTASRPSWRYTGLIAPYSGGGRSLMYWKRYNNEGETSAGRRSISNTPFGVVFTVEELPLGRYLSIKLRHQGGERIYR